MQAQLKNVQQIQATRLAFAAIFDNGSVVTWGLAGFGGSSCAVQKKLTNVQQIQASDAAFAAILGDGSVVTWALVGLVVAVVTFRISCRMFSTSKPVKELLRPFLVTDES